MKGCIYIFKEVLAKAKPVCEKIKPLCVGAKKVYGKFHNLEKSIKSVLFLCLALLAIVYSFAVCDVRIAYKVDFQGKYIATVENVAQFENAVSMVEKKVEGVNVKKSVEDVKYVAAVVRHDLINKDAEVADAIMECAKDIVFASAVYIDDVEYTRVSGINVTEYLEEYKNSFLLEGVESQSYYAERITVKEDYFAADSIDDPEIFRQILRNNVNVVTTVVNSEEYSIPFGTITQKNNSKTIDYRIVEVAGVKGTAARQTKYTYINGEYVGAETLDDVVITEPVNQVVTVGTQPKTASKAEISYAGSCGFIFPLPNGSWKVSAYWGDGRGHQAIDLSAKANTSIFAVKAGTVTYAGWRGGYGYLVEIDHGNGLVTRYAHANKLCVANGQKVSAGTVIALVGSTGNSTGNHLHFEVVRDGVRCNPAPYIGL